MIILTLVYGFSLFDLIVCFLIHAVRFFNLYFTATQGASIGDSSQSGTWDKTDDHAHR